jgi:DNA primase
MRLVNDYGEEAAYICPFIGCNDDSGHFHVNKLKRVYHCFKCNKSGRLKDLDYEVSTDFIDIDSLKSAFDEAFLTSFEEIKLPEDYEIVNSDYPDMYSYLLKRGIDDIKIQKYKIGCTSTDKRTYIWFPDFDGDGNLLFWSMRSYTDKSLLRWKFPISKKYGIYKSTNLYGYHNARYFDRIVVVEGITDVLAGGANYICTYGTCYSTMQLYRIADMPASEIIIMYDGDFGSASSGVKKGREKGRELAQKLSKLRNGIRLASLPQNTDPGMFSREELLHFEDKSQTIENEYTLNFL